MSHKLFSRECKFMIGATETHLIPIHDLPEFGFVGRSNVGKSSLINSITNRLSLARTSNTPGSTRQLNFFNLDDQVVIVDLPGYGYAKAARSDVKTWQKLIKKYLGGRINLQRVFVLIDSRHGIKENDVEYMKFLDEVAAPYQVILTKTDLINKSELEEVKKNVETYYLKHTAMIHGVIACSSKKKYGILDLQTEIINITGIKE